ncbi:MAG: hypothetical protein LUG17_01495 [Clostridiales bacterium]|nr:hypothetical protein [Clostridiales bacterium]
MANSSNFIVADFPSVRKSEPLFFSPILLLSAFFAGHFAENARFSRKMQELFHDAPPLLHREKGKKQVSGCVLPANLL